MHRKKEQRIAIIGAGATVLAAAEALRDQGFGDVTILEKSGQVGGCTYSATHRCGDGRELAYALGTLQPLQNGHLTRLMKKYGGKRQDRIPARLHPLAEGRDVFRTDDLGLRYLVRHLSSLVSDAVKLARNGLKCRDFARPGLNFRYVAGPGCTIDEWLDLKYDPYRAARDNANEIGAPWSRRRLTLTTFDRNTGGMIHAHPA